MGSREEIKHLLAEAAKFYAAKDYEKSTNLYSEVNALHDALTGTSSADYLFLYGKSLYQLALSQSEVFGKDEEPVGDEDDSDEEESSKKNELYQFSEALAEGDEAEKEDGAQQENEEVGGELPCGNEHEEGHDEDQEEEPSEFENAWEILELARSVYEKQPEETETLRKLSETYDILGEISLETENFPQAKQDFEKCLELRQTIYGPDDATHRLIIESYYKLSLVLEFDPNDAKACQENLRKAVELLGARIKEKGAEEGDDGLLEELKLKLKELKTTEASLNVIKQQSVAQIKEALGMPLGSQSESTAVNDLTSMVKKRKSKSEKDTASKKQKN
ncbi:LAQU0S02e07998g1_1 [Lachancea quebecensis]|uniref:LAQU0S02e07998g1_1 n=1 Tax=Lachancea quebecensis TaxID=1654605 RepID=A0A0P1KN26_9SACH|nr:LAQU0S02e07998g1_1 [Lachancea quebecensis]